jgi:hypothetical protein
LLQRGAYHVMMVVEDTTPHIAVLQIIKKNLDSLRLYKMPGDITALR